MIENIVIWTVRIIGVVFSIIVFIAINPIVQNSMNTLSGIWLFYTIPLICLYFITFKLGNEVTKNLKKVDL